MDFLKVGKIFLFRENNATKGFPSKISLFLVGFYGDLSCFFLILSHTLIEKLGFSLLKRGRKYY